MLDKQNVTILFVKHIFLWVYCLNNSLTPLLFYIKDNFYPYLLDKKFGNYQ